VSEAKNPNQTVAVAGAGHHNGKIDEVVSPFNQAARLKEVIQICKQP
jgi:hypothetical protein